MRPFGFPPLHKKANKVLQRWRVLAFYRIASCLRDLVLSCLRHNIVSSSSYSWVNQFSCWLHFTFPGSKVQSTFARSRLVTDPRSWEPNAKELGANLKTLLSSSFTTSARRLYQRAWVVFRQFYAQFYNCTDPELPLPQHVFLFSISYLSFHKSAYSTIKLYLSTISYVHKLKGFIDRTKSFVVEKLSTALCRQQPLDIRLTAVTTCMSR